MKGWSGFVAVVLVAAVMVGIAAAQGLTPGQCNNQKNDIENTCRNVRALVMGQPSAACCQLVRAANVECVCQFVTHKLVAALGGADRAIRLIRGCGRTIPRNFYCGSVRTPP